MVLGWPRARVSRTAARLERAGLIRKGRMGDDIFVAPHGARLVHPGWARGVEALTAVLRSLAVEGWTARRCRGHLADLTNHLAQRGAVAVYPAGARAASIRSLIKRLAGESPAPDVLFVYTGKPGPLRRAYWPKVSKPLLQIRDLREVSG